MKCQYCKAKVFWLWYYTYDHMCHYCDRAKQKVEDEKKAEESLKFEAEERRKIRARKKYFR